MMPKRIGILIFDEVDLLDVGGPYEVFLTAGRLRERQNLENPFEVVTIGLSAAPVTAYGGMGLVPTATVEAVENLDVVVIPGAIDIEAVARRPAIRSAVEQLIEASEVVTSVCTGAFLLGDAGLLEDIAFTTHWEDVDALAARLGSDRGVEALWIDSGRVVTAGGLSNGIAMALHLVERLEGRELAVATARQIDFRWT